MTDRDIDRAAALVRATPIPPITPEIIHERHTVPGSLRYGERRRSLPVEGAGARLTPFTAAAASFGEGLAALGLAIALAGSIYMVARVATSLL